MEHLVAFGGCDEGVTGHCEHLALQGWDGRSGGWEVDG